ncbi:MAG TPA: hypothetical protein VNA11_08140 [Pseudonocardia sp.]|jgi:hypothetical protein|nr:hypothetical protein [Pseudonocardia sp.]
MTAGTDLAYRTDGLRDGAGSAQETADAADGLAGRAAGVVVDAVMFGDVEQAGPVGAALVAARDGVAALAREVQRVHDDLAQRTRWTAVAGEHLTSDTTALARSPSSSVR